MITLPDIIGLSGVALLIASYGLLQFDRIDPKSFWYSFNNMCVAVLVAFSLLYNFILAIIVIEFFWFLSCVYGLWKWTKRND